MWAKGNDGNHQSEMKDTQGPERVELSLLAGINEWSVDDVVSLFTKCKLVAAGASLPVPPLVFSPLFSTLVAAGASLPVPPLVFSPLFSTIVLHGPFC